MNCPSPTVLDSCKCGNSGDDSTVYIDCHSRISDDAAAGTILTEILYDTTISPTSRLDLSYNALTIVPAEVRYFKELNFVYLVSNQIDTVPTGSFDFAPSPTIRPIEIYLSLNPLGNVENGAFKGLYDLSFN